MLRSEIENSIDQLNNALEESGIDKIFSEIRERGGRRRSRLIVENDRSITGV